MLPAQLLVWMLSRMSLWLQRLSLFLYLLLLVLPFTLRLLPWHPLQETVTAWMKPTRLLTRRECLQSQELRELRADRMLWREEVTQHLVTETHQQETAQQAEL